MLSTTGNRVMVRRCLGVAGIAHLPFGELCALNRIRVGT